MGEVSPKTECESVLRWRCTHDESVHVEDESVGGQRAGDVETEGDPPGPVAPFLDPSEQQSVDHPDQAVPERYRRYIGSDQSVNMRGGVSPSEERFTRSGRIAASPKATQRRREEFSSVRSSWTPMVLPEGRLSNIMALRGGLVRGPKGEDV